MRSRQRVWIKYKEKHQWKAFARERNRYNKQLDYYKHNGVVKQIDDAGKDTRKLHKIVNSILGWKTDNPLPDHDDPAVLAEEFAELSMKK